jgi:hypothetical protein
VLTRSVLQHLPDFWKQVALLRMNRMLKTGGLLYIFDVVFDFAPEEYIPKMNGFIDAFAPDCGRADPGGNRNPFSR